VDESGSSSSSNPAPFLQRGSVVDRLSIGPHCRWDDDVVSEGLQGVRALVSFGREEMRNSRSYQATDRLSLRRPRRRLDRRNRNRMRSRSRNRGGDNLSLDGSTEGGGGEGGSSGSLTPTDTVSDWGGISPVGSLVSEDPSVSQQNISGEAGIQIVSYENGLMLDDTAATNTSVASSAKPAKLNMSNNSASGSRSDVSDMVLSGNALTAEMKVDLQNKLRSILHALAARHEAVGYCQGMDYVVAHLLRVLQDTILLREVQRSFK